MCVPFNSIASLPLLKQDTADAAVCFSEHFVRDSVSIFLVGGLVFGCRPSDSSVNGC